MTLTARSFINMCRDIGYYWTRIVSYIVVSISVGTIFYDVGYSYTSILARVSCGGFITGFMTFMSIGGFPSFLEEMKVKIINLCCGLKISGPAMMKMQFNLCCCRCSTKRG